MINKASAKTKIIFIIKSIIGLAIFGFLLGKLNFSVLVEIIVSALPLPFIYGLCFYVLALMADILKFRSACSNHLSITASARMVFTGLLFNNFFPSNIGGDAYIILRMRNFDIPPGRGVFYVLSNRITGFVALLLLGFVVVMCSPVTRHFLIDFAMRFWNQLNISGAWVIVIVVIIIIAAAVVLYRFSLNIRSLFLSTVNQLRDYMQRSALRTLAFGVLYQMLRALAITCIASSLGCKISLLVVAVILALVAMVTMLPISIGGLGVRESTMSYLLYHAGCPLEIAVTVALVNLAVLWLNSLVGLSVFVIEKQ